MRWIGVGATVLLTVLPLAARGCGSEDTSPTADDGRHQFSGTFTKYKFNTTLDAVHGDISACRWRIEVEPLAGLKAGEKPRVVQKGDYGNAKIKVEEPDTVKVFLVSSRCGTWQPK